MLRVTRRAFRHPVLSGITDDMLDFWGDESYAGPAPHTCVARTLYRKDGRQNVCCVLDAGEGGFGNGDLACMALCEAPVGAGLVLACQLRITETFDTIPAARRLLLNLLRRAHTYAPETHNVLICDGADTPAVQAAVQAARESARVIINNASEPTLAALSTALNIPLRVKDVGPVYQLVRAARDPVLNGISNEDTCGIERFSYCSNEAVNTIVATRCLAPVRHLEPLLKTAAQKGYSGNTTTERSARHCMQLARGVSCMNPSSLTARALVNADESHCVVAHQRK